MNKIVTGAPNFVFVEPTSIPHVLNVAACEFGTDQD